MNASPIEAAGLSIALLMCVGGGCRSFEYRDVNIAIFDAETRAPISGAKVRAEYPASPFTWTPRRDHAIAGADGLTPLRVAVEWTPCVFVDAPRYS